MKLNRFDLSSSLYCAVKSLCLSYKNQSVNFVKIKVTLCLEIHKKHKCTLDGTFNIFVNPGCT